MQYPQSFLTLEGVPGVATPLLRHLPETYVSETNKVATTWSALLDSDLAFRPHPKSRPIREILEHQILSERRFFAEFMGLSEPPPAELLPAAPGAPAAPVAAYIRRFVELARARLPAIARGDEAWWLAEVPFFDTRRERIWVFWRRVLHTAHHRAQVGDCLKPLGRVVPPTYGPSGDVTWDGADPTNTVAAAGRG